jgi:hypothetical protein
MVEPMPINAEGAEGAGTVTEPAPLSDGLLDSMSASVSVEESSVDMSDEPRAGGSVAGGASDAAGSETDSPAAEDTDVAAVVLLVVVGVRDAEVEYVDGESDGEEVEAAAAAAAAAAADADGMVNGVPMPEDICAAEPAEIRDEAAAPAISPSADAGG